MLRQGDLVLVPGPLLEEPVNVLQREHIALRPGVVVVQLHSDAPSVRGPSHETCYIFILEFPILGELKTNKCTIVS